MNYTDEQLRDAAAFLRQAYYATLPDVSNYHPQYSEEFLKKMDRLCYQYRFRRHVKSFLKTGVAAVVVLLIMGSIWLGISVDARAAFRTFLIEMYENTFIYRFFNDPADSVLGNYDIHKLPEGYSFVKHVNTSDTRTNIYSNKETVLILMYFRNNNQGALGVGADERIDTQVGKHFASFYLSTDGDSNDLVWLDEEDDIVFVLSGFLTEKQMVEIAESVAITSSRP